MWNRLIEGIYMPHGYCLLWEPWLVGLHAVSDVLTFGAYSAIPIAIWIFVRKRPNVELRGLALLFAAFILWCGLTHLFSMITLWHPVYELQGIVKGVTAVISVATAVMIFPLIPKALAIPSPRELQIANAQLSAEVLAHKKTLDLLEQARSDLEQRVATRTRDANEATARFKALFEHAPVAMVMIDRTLSVQQANAEAERVLGCSREALLGTKAADIVPEEVRLTLDTLDGSAVPRRISEINARRADAQPFPAEIGLSSLPGHGGAAIVVSIIDISERKREQERMQVVMRELSHRAKNLLAVIQGMIRQAIHSSSDLKAFEHSFSHRLQGLSRSHDLLVGKNWQGADLGDLVKTQLAFLKRDDPGAISINGPDILLTPAATQTLGLALHELVTNAAKHGALATDAGRINVDWMIEGAGAGAGETLRFVWREEGRPLSGLPVRRGFGRTVLERVVPRSVGGTATLEFAPEGFSWRLTAPMERVRAASVDLTIAA